MLFDLHIHTSRSFDSISSIKGIAAHAQRMGLQGIAITDHGASASEDLGEIGGKNDIWIIKGNEVQTEIGDIVALFITGTLKSQKAERLIDEIHDQGGIAVLAHPFKYHCNYPKPILEKLDAVEIVNARWKDLSRLTHYSDVNNVLSTVPGRTAGSDAHFSFEVGRACWVTPPLASPEELKKCICSNTGHAQATKCSTWLDDLSQCVKFLKNPSTRQLARILYRTARHALPSGKELLYEKE